MSFSLNTDSPLPLEKAFPFLKVSLQDKLSIVIILLSSLFIMLPVFVKGFPNGDDAETHLRWASEFRGELSDGVIYPRWLSEANYGQGSPAMLFYPPLPFYVVAGFSLLSSNILMALAMASWLAFFLSGLTMYRLARRMFSPHISLFVALFYLFIPYHIADFYQRSALSEFWTFAWIPLILDAAFCVVSKKESKTVFYLAFTYSLLLFTHLPITVAFSLILPGYILFLTRDLRQLLRLSSGLLMGIGLSAIYLLPVLFERKFVHIQVVLGADYKALFHFRDLRQTFSSLPFQQRANEEPITLAYWDCNWIAVALLLLFVFSVFLLWNERRRVTDGFLGNRNGRAILFIAGFSFFIITRYSRFLWKLIFVLPYLQFPFRWLVIASTGTVLLSGAAVNAMFQISHARVVYISLFAVLIAFNIGLSVLAIERAHLGRESSFATGEVPEYHPIWWVEGRPKEFKRSSIIIESGNAFAQPVDETGTRQSYQISAQTEAIIKFRTIYFPGWAARLNGKSIPIRPNAEGNIQIDIPPGEHTLSLSFEDTPARTAGKIVSIITLLLMLALHFVFRNRGKAKIA